MLKIVLVWTSCFLLLSCTNPDKIPSGVIQIHQMKSILEDMLEASAYVNVNVRIDTGGERQKRMKVLYSQVLGLHHISREKFLESYRFYETHPDQMQMLYDSMGVDISELRHVTDSISVVEMDSIRIAQVDSLARIKGDTIKKIAR
ncbi:MAG TPA: DUF4296 domain-containing protein [Chitinophagaceae bacterium]|nr:DUF4296 domain-containing protein [Chitinophagaceae bacterium]